MTRDDAIAVLAILAAAWPGAKALEDDMAVELWIEYFDGVGAEEARIVASELVLGEQWMPTIARFREAIVARRRREAQRFSAHALPSGERVTPIAEAQAHVAAIRRSLTSTNERNPC